MSGRKRRSQTSFDLNDTLDEGDVHSSQDRPGFREGSVVSMQLINFMTYGDNRITAGPELNLILGPNGTGKSALVCGLIIGLGGDASTTGRSGSLREYIKHGCEYALTRIELANPRGANHIIERRLMLTGNVSRGGGGDCKSEWRINGQISKQSDVREFVKKLNINVDNLCQFLPQERVVEFCKMNPHDLLENTEKAVGDMAAFKYHLELREMSRVILDSEKKKQSLKQKEQEDTTVNQRLEEEVQRLQEKKDIEKRIKSLELKKPWVEFESSKKEYDKLKGERDEKKLNLYRDKEKLEPLKRKKEEALRKINRRESVPLNHFNEWKSTGKRKTQKIKSLKEKLNAAADIFKIQLNEDKTRKQTIKKLKGELQFLQQKLDECTEDEDFDPRIRGMDTKIGDIDSKLTECESKKVNAEVATDKIIRDIRESEELIKRSDAVFRRMQRVQEMDQRAYEAVRWLRNNKEQFKKAIHPPIMTQINVCSKDFMAQVENTIARRDLFAFVCEDHQDLRKFSECLKRELDIQVALVIATNEPLNSFQPSVDRSALRNMNLGFTGYLKDFLTGPDAVMAYLCKQYKIHQIPVGGVSVEDNLDRIRGWGYKGVFFSNAKRFSITKSRYDGQESITAETLPPARILTIQSDEPMIQKETRRLTELKKKQQDINDRLKNLETELEKLQENRNTLDHERRKLIQLRDQKKTLESRVSLKQQELKRREVSKFNEKVEREKLVKLLENVNRALTSDLQQELPATGISETCNREVESYRFQLIHEYFERELNAANAQFLKAEEDIKTLEVMVGEAKKKALEKRSAAVEMTRSQNHELLDGGILAPDLIQMFASLPESLKDIDRDIHNLYLRKESMVGIVDESLEQDFNARKEAIRKNKQKISEITASLEAYRSKRSNTKKAWLKKLESVMAKIDKNFGLFMKRMGYAGEVVLKSGENELDDYGIGIRVKYRDSEELQELSGFHQSGGERSVATVIYMMALQELTLVPFRCIDEINQGMDAHNERKVFELMVQTATKNSSQYFLFSPKLLKGLEYSPQMEIHTITNSKSNAKNWTSAI